MSAYRTHYPSIVDDPEAARRIIQAVIEGDDGPYEEGEPERPYFDERDHYPELVRFRP